MNVTAESGRNSVKHQIELNVENEEDGAGRDGRTCLTRTKVSGANRDREILIFSVQLSTSRVGNLTRLVHTLLYVMSTHTSHLIPSPPRSLFPPGISDYFREHSDVGRGRGQEVRWRGGLSRLQEEGAFATFPPVVLISACSEPPNLPHQAGPKTERKNVRQTLLLTSPCRSSRCGGERENKKKVTREWIDEGITHEAKERAYVVERIDTILWERVLVLGSEMLWRHNTEGGKIKF